MTSLQRYSSKIKTHFKEDWTVKTRCNNNRLNVGGIISRKIKFKPLFVSLGLHKTSHEFDVIRSNYFCYTYEEINYILKFGDIYEKEDREKNIILSHFTIVEYTPSRASEYFSVFEKYFCASNNDCVTQYDLNDSIQLRTRVISRAENVDGIDNLLAKLKYFKTCAICDRRLQIWAKKKDYEEITDLFEDPTDIIVAEIFKFLQ